MRKPKFEDVFLAIILVFIAIILACLIIHGDAPNNSLYKSW